MLECKRVDNRKPRPLPLGHTPPQHLTRPHPPAVLDTVDYLLPEGRCVFRTCAAEKGRVVFQMVGILPVVFQMVGMYQLALRKCDARVGQVAQVADGRLLKREKNILRVGRRGRESISEVVTNGLLYTMLLCLPLCYP